MTDLTRFPAIRRATLIGAVINALLGVAKVVVGIIGHSHALVADGWHSFSDFATDILVLWAAWMGGQDADDDHPYGHARIETATTLALSVAIVFVSGGILWDALAHFLHPSTSHHPSLLTFFVALISIIANEGLYRYTAHVGKKTDSNLLNANAWHNRGDAASSLIVLLGIGASFFGIHYADSLAALFVGLFVLKMAWDLGWPSLCELVDTGLDATTLARIQALIRAVPGVDALHQLRSRKMGGQVLVDVHVLVSPKISVSEGHFVSEQVRLRLLKEIETVSDVTVHIDPEDDEVFETPTHLPARPLIEAMITKSLASQVPSPAIRQLTIHYLAGNIEVDLVFEAIPYERLQTLEKMLNQDLKSQAAFAAIRCYC